MGKCQADNGNGKRWESTVGTAPDGKIRIDPEVSGAFTGKHEKSNKNLVGTCRENGISKPHKIMFIVDSRFLYVGNFISDNKIEGLRFDLTALCSEEKRKKEQTGDDDWVAVKVT